MMCGGAGKAVAADEETKQVCEKVRFIIQGTTLLDLV